MMAPTWLLSARFTSISVSPSGVNAKSLNATRAGSTPPFVVGGEIGSGGYPVDVFPSLEHPIVATFITPVRSVGIRALDVGWNGVRIDAIDVLGNVVAFDQVYGVTQTGDGEYFDLHVSGGAITSVRMYQPTTGNPDGILWDNFVFTPIANVSGCFKLDDFPGVNRKVILDENLTTDQVTYTDEQGCYSFGSADKSKPFTVIIQSTWKPASSPTTVQATALSANSAKIDWQYDPSDASSFKIFRKKGTSGTWALKHTSGAADRTYTDPTAFSNDTYDYYYYIRSCNAAGCSPASETVEMTH